MQRQRRATTKRKTANQNPAPVIGITILVVDRRYGKSKDVAEFNNVPLDWSSRKIREHFGVGEHLALYGADEGVPRTLISAGVQDA